MFDPRQCATSPIPAGVEIVSRKTYLRETRGRRVAELEHNFNDDKDACSGTVDCLLLIGRCDTSPGHGVRAKLVSRNSRLKLESHVHAVTDATAVPRMIAPRPTLTPPFDLSRCQRCGPLL